MDKASSSEENIVGVIDYGCGNLQSIANAPIKLGASYKVISNPNDLEHFQDKGLYFNPNNPPEKTGEDDLDIRPKSFIWI